MANLTSTMLLPLVVFDMLALLFGIPSLIISDLPTLTLSSNLIYMTLSSDLRQGALHAIFHDGSRKSDHDYLIGVNDMTVNDSEMCVR